MALEKTKQRSDCRFPTGKVREPRPYRHPDTSPRELPRGKDLPDGDGIPMDSDWVVDQTRVYLIHPLREHFSRTGQAAYVSGGSFVYYDPDREPVGPDFYVVLGGRQEGQPKWVAWEAGWLMPATVFEFLSPSTEVRDRGEKFCIYRDALRVKDYVLVDQESLRIEVYHLQSERYVSQEPAQDGWYELPSLGLQLGVEGDRLRLRTTHGELLPTASETAAHERQRAEQERQRADQLEAENRRLFDELDRLRNRPTD
ncbi:Uma2 family endonuclease [bacterium]|nr:Uma2 family endonuclease [bacterium]